MPHYVGLDVSLKLTAICIVNERGKIVREGSVASNPEAIAAHSSSRMRRMSRGSGLRRERHQRGYGPSSACWGYPSSASMPGMQRPL